MRATRIVTLLTDFGARDGYVAALKGVIWSLAPGAQVVDAAHDIPPQDIRSGAWVLRQYAPLYPGGTIHLAVVDPGVGTARRALAVEADGCTYLAPDNGLLWWVLQACRVIRVGALRAQVHRPGVPSSTFHGRDVFAHAAGLLAAGASWVDLAEPCEPVSTPLWSTPRQEGRRIMGEVIHVDRFGNLVTNIRPSDLPGAAHRDLEIEVGGIRVRGLASTYGDAAAGQPVAYVGSDGHLEVAINQGSAAQEGAAASGSVVAITNL
jgi:S-adenosylmethionine hydrolase